MLRTYPLNNFIQTPDPGNTGGGKHFFMLDFLLQELKNTSMLEYIAVIAGIIQVLLARKNNILLYPFGIISTTISIYIFTNVDLYANALLNFYYVVVSIYGWIHWSRKKNETPLPITKANKRDYTIASAITVLSFLILTFVLIQFTNSSTVIPDALVTAFAWAGTWLLTQRKLENWIFLNISNAIGIPLEFHKGLYLYSILTLILFIVAISGYIAWKKELDNE